jgi:hypothetical protein
MHSILELLSAVLSFAGGALLSIDALRLKRRIRAESGAQDFLNALRTVGAADALKDEQGRALNTVTALQLWFANRSLKWTWLGFLLMTAGFLLQVFESACKIAAAS